MKHIFSLLVGALMCSTLFFTSCNQGDSSLTESDVRRIIREEADDPNSGSSSQDEGVGQSSSEVGDVSFTGVPARRTTKRPEVGVEEWEYRESGMVKTSGGGPIQLDSKQAGIFLATLRNGWDYINSHPNDTWVWRDGSVVGAPGKDQVTLADGRRYEFYLRLKGVDNKAYFWARSVSDLYIDQMFFEYDYQKQQNAGTLTYWHFTPKEVKKGEVIRDTGEVIMDDEKAIARFTEMVKKVPLIASVPPGSTKSEKAIAFDKTPQEILLAKLPGPTEKSEKKDTVAKESPSEKSGVVGSLELKKLDKITPSKETENKTEIKDKTPPSNKKKK